MSTILDLPSRKPQVTDPAAFENWERARRDQFEEIFRAAPHLSMSEWAERYRFLAKGASGEPGPWRTSRVPYMKEIMDAISDPEVEEIVLIKSAQVAYTEGIINNAIGYFVDQDPSPILVVQPADGDAEKFSKKKLAPMIQASPRVRAKISMSARDSGNTILEKSFPGGFLGITGATSPKGLARDSVRVLLLDEVDRYPASAGAEGDPVNLARRRTNGFANRKIVMGSTPTIKGLSRIEKGYDNSDQREWEVPCPHCGTYQVLRWGGRDDKFGIKWDEGDPETAAYLCVSCAALIEEHQKQKMVAAGRWVARKPGHPVRGYKINALVSLFDGARWSRIVREFIDAKDDRELLKVFVNTVLGETWEETGETLTTEGLAARAETYPTEVPTSVGVLTAGVDVQGDRLEVLIVGWGAGEESWRIRHERLYGDPDMPEVWSRLEQLIAKPYTHEAGAELRIRACCIDSGFKTTEVYGFVKPRQGRNIFAVKGVEGNNKPPLSRATRANRDGIKIFTVGTIQMKDTLFARLRKSQPGPGYIHFYSGLDAEYYAQLGGERVVYHKENYRTIRTYAKTRDRNEAIDLEVYALAALHALGAGLRQQLGAHVKAVQDEGAKIKAAAEQPAVQAPAPQRRRRSSWLYPDG